MKLRWRRWFKILVSLLVVAVVAGAAALVFAWTRHDRAVVLPQPAGPYAVGRVEYDWLDASRPETFTPDPDDHRELVAWVWYPVAAGAPGRPLAYLPDAWRAAGERSRGGILAGFFTQNLAAVQAHAVGGLPIAPSSKPYPVVICQPGLGPSHPDYTTLAEDLASRGYVVVATTPTYSANVAVFSDGRVAEGIDAATVPDSASPAESNAILDKLIVVWAADDRFVMDRLAALNAGDPDARFRGHLDLGAIGVMGHSFGGASAAETCSLDARCKAGIDLDGSPYGDVIDTGLKMPFLFMWSEPTLGQQEVQAQTERDVQALVSHSTAPVYELTLTGARHFNFADYAVLYEPLLRPMQMLGSIDGRRGLAVTTAYAAAFFDQYLKGQPSAFHAGPDPAYPEVRLTIYPRK